MNIKRFNLGILPGILSIILFVEISCFLRESGKYNRVSKQIKNASEELTVFTKDPRMIPNQEELDYLTETTTSLNTLLQQTIYTHKSMASHEIPLESLEFKEKLTEFDESYGKFKIPIPKGLGFKEYQGFSLPAASEMKTLSRQLTFIVQIVNLLIENNVDAISDMKRLPVEIIKSTRSSKIIFSAYHFGFIFKINHKNLIAFWDTVLSLPSVIKIKSFSITSNYSEGDLSSEAQLITVDLHLCLLEYEE